MSNMSPLDAAFVTEALDGVDTGSEIVNMRDGHSEFWGADQLAGKLENTDHKVDWIHHNTKAEKPPGADTITLMKDGGEQAEWDDGFLVTRTPNLNGIEMKQAVDGCHVKFGFTTNPQDTNLYENGFYIGLFENGAAVRGLRGKHPETMAKYELNETFTARILRGSVTCFRNEEAEPFDVVGTCEEEGTSMHGMIHIKEKDALGQLEHVHAIALVNSIDINGNSLTDAGIERLATSLEVPFTKIHHLDIGLNRIRDAGAARIAEVLEKSVCRIRTLVLSHNEIGDEGAARLAEALAKAGSKVNKVWLAGNQIADQGAIKLAEMLEKETCELDLIELAWNKIEDEGAQRLIQALSKPECKVTHFTLDHNKYIDRKTRKMLTAIMGKVPRLLDMT